MKKIVHVWIVLSVSFVLVSCGSFAKEFNIHFDSNGGSDVSDIETRGTTFISLPNDPIKEGHTFEGWYWDNQTFDVPFTSDSLEEQSISSDVTVYAKWVLNQYTIEFKDDDGSILQVVEYDFGEDISSGFGTTTLLKEGYTFGGWYSNTERTIPYVFDTMPSNNITLYAKWDALDISDIELYLSNLIPNEITENINLPVDYLDYTITWNSSDPEILSNTGVYNRPYTPTTLTVTAIIEFEQHIVTKTYEVDVAGYKSLSAPFASSYIYRDYYLVNDSFFTTLDIINCAFITADYMGTLTGTSVLNNIDTYIMPKAKENGNWVIFSIAPDSDWSEIASSSTRINMFADNIVEMINTYGFDGVDIDWETPLSYEATSFTEMMRVIYEKVKANNPNHLVTAAIAGGMWQPPRYDLTNSHQYIDYINMMTYGMVSNNGYYQNALSPSTIFANPEDLAGKTLTSCSIEESVAIYHSYGIPNNKIVVGVAFYGIKQTRTYNTSTQTWSSWSSEGSVSYNYISNVYLKDSSYQYYYDVNAGVPYIMKTDGSVFISFDNPRSIAQKSEFIIDNGLAGIMYWENGLDSTGALLTAIDAEIND